MKNATVTNQPTSKPKAGVLKQLAIGFTVGIFPVAAFILSDDMYTVAITAFVSALVFIAAATGKNINPKPLKPAEPKAQALDEALNALKEKFILVSGSTIPTHTVTAVAGYVTGISNTKIYNKTDFILSEKEALLELISNAQKLGANAIINLHMKTGSYGNGYIRSQVIYTGTAVMTTQKNTSKTKRYASGGATTASKAQDHTQQMRAVWIERYWQKAQEQKQMDYENSLTKRTTLDPSGIHPFSLFRDDNN